MNDTPTPRERFRKTLDISTGVSEFLADCNTAYISWLETELTAVTEQRDRLAEAIRKHKFCGVELYEALQSLNQPKP